MDNLKFKLTIAFDGANYTGWQTQANGIGVQQKIEAAALKIFPGATGVQSSSRTDAGVHALGMVAHLEIPRSQFHMTVAKLALALNAHLPEDVRVMSARRCPADFHARFDAKGKQYRYFVWNAPAHNPLLRKQSWHVAKKLDLPAMRKAATFFPGRRDFKSFAGTRCYEPESTVRKLTRCEIKRHGPLLTFLIEGDGFLYKMCRGIVGTLVQVGQGKIKPGEIRRILARKDRRVAGMTAPAHGLVLWRVFY